jgi:hypothetical protein
VCGGLVQNEQFDLSLFEELNRLIESAVLYDHIVLLGEYRLSSGALIDAFSKAGVLKRLTEEELRELVLRPETQKRFEKTMRRLFGPGVVDAEDAQAVTLLDLRITPNSFAQMSYNAMVDQVMGMGSTSGFDTSQFSQWLTRNIFATRYHLDYARSLPFGARRAITRCLPNSAQPSLISG